MHALNQLNLFASESENEILGVWTCDPFDIGDTEFGFAVTHKVNYKSDGTSIDTEIWRFTGPQDFWFSVDYSGPWKIENDILTETLVKTEVTYVSNDDFHSKEAVIVVLSEMQQPDEVVISKIVKISKSKLVTKNTTYGDIGTCIRGMNG
ncbi:hypothetical protein [Colwellia sp. TT2012]|uniref:hypothetical protein n=1 Tax=Colwellia sp. TT2012 TaxID=1720342 RepID=UPI00070C1347|nr:hypothetical protein [Colwellia sp. TT2012]